MKLVTARTDANGDLHIVFHLSRVDLQWLGLIEKGESFKFSQFGKDFIQAHPEPEDLPDALERLISARRWEEKLSGAVPRPN